MRMERADSATDGVCPTRAWPAFLAAAGCLCAAFLAASNAWSLDLPPRYHVYEEVALELDTLAADYPELMHVDTIGVSTVDSMVIWAVKISDDVELDEDEPAILFHAMHHAEEIIGLEVAMYTINDLLENYGVNSHITGLVNSTEIWFVPLHNPEGHKVVTDWLDPSFRKNKRDNNGNSIFDYVPGIGGDIDGVDLNRNYSLNWIHSTDEWSSDYYRGPGPFSENEARALRDVAQAQRFTLALLYHSARTGTKEIVYYPWDWGGKHPPDFPIIDDLARELASRIEKDEGGVSYDYQVSGARQSFARDWFYANEGTLALLIEVGSDVLPPEALVDDICERVLEGVYYLLDRLHGSGDASGAALTGHVTDASTAVPLAAEVEILEAQGSILEPRLADPEYGRYRRILLPGTYHAAFSMEGYEPETLQVTVNDAVPTVRDIQLEPLATSLLSGTVTEATTGDPLEAELVFIGQGTDTAFAQPGTGEYSILLYNADYTVLVEAAGHVIEVDEIAVAGPATEDFELAVGATLFADDFEGALGAWTTGGAGDEWGITDSLFHSSSHSLSDSPGSMYGDSADAWIALSEGVDLSTHGDAHLVYWETVYLEHDYDYGVTEVSTDGGSNWLLLDDPVTGVDLSWHRVIHSLDEFCGAGGEPLFVRYRLQSDSTIVDDGWHIDDVEIMAGGEPPGVEEGEEEPSGISAPFYLRQNLPNPFVGSTAIPLSVTGGGEKVSLAIYNLAGQLVRRLAEEELAPGRHLVLWDGRDMGGNEVGSGVYFVRLTEGGRSATRKLVRVRGPARALRSGGD